MNILVKGNFLNHLGWDLFNHEMVIYRHNFEKEMNLTSVL